MSTQSEDLAYNQGRLDAQAEMAPRIQALQETVAAYKKMTNEILEQVTKGLHPLAMLRASIGRTPLPAPRYNAAIDDVGAIPNSVRSSTERDVCTESNCPRCRAADWDKKNHSHTGISK